MIKKMIYEQVNFGNNKIKIQVATIILVYKTERLI